MEAIARAGLQVVGADLDHSTRRWRLRRRRARRRGAIARAQQMRVHVRMSSPPSLFVRSVPPATAASPRRRATAATLAAALELARAAVAGHPPQHQIADGNASGSLSARIATYCAVQSPMPGMARSASSVERRRTRRAVADRACQRAQRRARAEMMPASSSGASASCAGVGNRPSRAPPTPSIGVPHRSATRPAIVVAAVTEICWPRIARTVTSNGSHAPGVRMPACAATARLQAAHRPTTVRAISARIGAEIEHAPHPLDDRQQRARIAELAHRASAPGPSSAGDDRDRARRAVDRDRPLVAVGFDALDARRGARAPESQSPLPVVRRPVGEAEAIAVRTDRCACARAGAARSACANRSAAFRR